MPDEEVVVYGLDMDDPENAELVKEKWGKEHETVLEPDHLPKSDLEARLAIQKGVDIKNLAVPKNGVATYLPAAGGSSSGADEYPKILGLRYTYNGEDYVIINTGDSYTSWVAAKCEGNPIPIIEAFLTDNPDYAEDSGFDAGIS